MIIIKNINKNNDKSNIEHFKLIDSALLYNKNSKHGIIRIHNKNIFETIKKDELTLFEQSEVYADTLYDIFDVDLFSTMANSDEGKMHAYVSLMEPSYNIKMEGEIINRKNGLVLAKIKPIEINNSAKLELKDDFKIEEQVNLNELALSVSVEWTKGKEKQKLLKTVDLSLSSGLLKYKHSHPVKKVEGSSPIVIKTPEGKLPEKHNIPVDNEHIVVTILRFPDDYGDVDYVCGFGRTKTNKPYFGLPGAGRIIAPKGVSFLQDKCEGVCIIESLEGGGYCAAASKNIFDVKGDLGNDFSKNDSEYSTVKGDIKFQANGNIIDYTMMAAWNGGNLIYNEKGEFTRKIFDYKMSLKLARNDGGFFNVCITSKDKNDYVMDYIHEIKPISIMFGCLLEGSLIQTVNSGEIKIENLNIGDELVDPFDKSNKLIVSNVWRGIEIIPLIKITVKSGSYLYMTKQHPVYSNGRIIRACELKIGDMLYDGITEIEITEINFIDKGTTKIYNLDLKSYDEIDTLKKHCFIANRIIVGDMYLQNCEF